MEILVICPVYVNREEGKIRAFDVDTHLYIDFS